MYQRIIGLFACGSAGYGLLELIWRGYTHWSMILTGGVIFTAMAPVRRILQHPTWVESGLTGAMLITITEFMVGRIVNLRYHLQVWDYSKEVGNWKGQICMKYMVLWGLLSIPAMALSERIDTLLCSSKKSCANHTNGI